MHDSPPRKRLLTLREASDFLSLSIVTLRNLISSGKLGSVRANPRGKLLIPLQELESFIERNARTPNARAREEVKS